MSCNHCLLDSIEVYLLGLSWDSEIFDFYLHFQCGFDAGDCGFEYFFKEMWGIDAAKLTSGQPFQLPSDRAVQIYFTNFEVLISYFSHFM